MSAGGYDGPPMSSSFSRFERGAPLNGIRNPYGRPSNALPRRPSPPSGSLRRPYDSYVPNRPEGSFRENTPNVYRPNSYRPDYAGSYYSRSPSPDPYIAPSRSSDPDIWDPHSWRPPPVETSNAVWPERKPLPPSPTTSARGRAQRDDIPSRTFEPSDSWKQTHVDRPGRPDHSPPSDRYFDRRGRNSMDGSPERPMRLDRVPAFLPGGDRYRPGPPKREGFLMGRSDSYRPQYDNGRTPIRRDPISPPVSRMRRDSGSFTHTRASSRHDSPYTARTLSRKGSPSPHSLISPIHTPSRPVPDADTWSYPASVKHDVSTRPLSRSSIASTQASDKQSPPPPQLPEPKVPESPNPEITSVIQTSKIPDPIVTTVSEPPKNVEILNPEPQKPTKPPNGAAYPEKVSKDFFTDRDTQTPPGLISSKDKKKATSESLVSAVADKVEQNLGTITPSIDSHSEAEVPTEIPKEDLHVNGALRSTPEHQIPSIPSVSSPPSPIPRPLTPPPSAPVSVAPGVPSPPIDLQSSSNDDDVALEIKQPKPSYLPSPPPKDIEMDIDIPPTTHSPNNDLEPVLPPSPVIDTVLPVVRPSPYPTPEEIPPFSEAKTKEEARRIFVMMRLLCNHETREERVNPVLMQNLAISTPLEVHPTATPDTLLDRMFSGQEMEERMASFIKTRPMLSSYLEQRHEQVEDKVARLREEYLLLHERWVAHCNALNEQQKALASEHEMQHTGRTTRRSTAITDAVRSDFEMEQIIASLGVDDATDPTHLSVRNVAKIPDMVCVVNGQVDYLFDDTSHRVENPKEYYAPRTGIDDWKEDEKRIFLDKFAAYPKQFGIIADFLPNKTPAQCVDYYYLHKHKFIDFRKVVSQLAPNKRRRRGVGKKKGNGLLVDIALHDMEVSRGTTTPGTASASAPPATTRAPRGRKAAAKRIGVQFEGTPTSTPTPEPESVAPTRGRRRRTAVATTLATTITAASVVEKTPSVAPSVPPYRAPSAPPSAPPPAPPPVVITPTPAKKVPPPSPPRAPTPTPIPTPTPVPVRRADTPEPEPEQRPIKKAKRTRRIKSAATVPDDPPSPSAENDKTLPWPTTGVNGGSSELGLGKTQGESYGQYSGMKPPPAPAVSQWSEDDKTLFISLLSQHGDNFKRIAAAMPNKTTIQVSNYYADNKVKLGLASIAAGAPRRSPTPEHEPWNEMPYNPSGLLRTNRGPSSPMSSLSYDAQRSFRPPPASYPEQTRHMMSDGLSPHSTPASISRAQQQHMYHERMGHVLAPPLQPPMARLGSNNPPVPDNRRATLYNGTSPPYPFPNPPDHRDGYPPGKYTGDGRSYMPSSPQMQPLPSYYGVYPSSAPPPTSSTGTPLSAPSTASIIHSPTGMHEKLPMQPLHAHGYPPHSEPPPHSSYYQHPPPPPPMPGRPREDSRTQQWGPQIFGYRERASSFNAGQGGRRENPYPMLNDAPPGSAPPSTRSSHESGSYMGSASGPTDSGPSKSHYNNHI